MRLRLMALTNNVTGLNIVGVLAERVRNVAGNEDTLNTEIDPCQR